MLFYLQKAENHKQKQWSIINEKNDIHLWLINIANRYEILNQYRIKQ